MTRAARREGRVGRFARPSTMMPGLSLSPVAFSLPSSSSKRRRRRQQASAPSSPGRVAKRPGVKRDRPNHPGGEVSPGLCSGASVSEPKDLGPYFR
ncbi:hypothetical protein MTO96_012910 [Rhipicephalus appendiculatus]